MLRIQYGNYSCLHRLISDKDLQLIRRYDKRAPELRAGMLDEVSEGWASTM